MRIVIDTNVVASAIFFGGKPRQLLEMLLQHDFDAFVSRQILEEYQETIEYLCNQYPKKKISVPLTHIVTACRLIEPVSKVAVCRDPDDNMFIECAIDSHSLYVVSGDNDLLSLRQVQDVEIITVAEFISRMNTH